MIVDIDFILVNKLSSTGDNISKMTNSKCQVNAQWSIQVFNKYYHANFSLYILILNTYFKVIQILNKSDFSGKNINFKYVEIWYIIYVAK